jgi:glucose-1-phosphate thymidylyltransferase
MIALILAAGYGTRLYPLTKRFPKPLLKVKGKPIINYIADKLSAIPEIDEILVVTNSKFFKDFSAWSKGYKCSKKIRVINDLTKSLADRRGAVGDMKFALEKAKVCDDVLVIGGDNLIEGRLDKFIDFACRTRGPSIGIYDIKLKSEAVNYGVVKLDNSRRIADFKEKPKKPASTLVAMCLYYFPKDSLMFLKTYIRENKSKLDATGFYIDWLRRRVPVYGFEFSGAWFDIGDHKFYNRANQRVLPN